jgi:transposase-like protein
MLLAKNLKQKKLNKKLLNKLLEFFHIQKSINKQMYHFNLSVIYKIHSIFHVFLKLYNHKLNDDFILKYFMFKLIDNEQE